RLSSSPRERRGQDCFFSASGVLGGEDLSRYCFFRGNPVNLFLQSLFGKSLAFQNPLAVLDHIGMTAQVSHAVFAGETPHISVLAQQVVHRSEEHTSELQSPCK